jgi:hypothetical protein
VCVPTFVHDQALADGAADALRQVKGCASAAAGAAGGKRGSSTNSSVRNQPISHFEPLCRFVSEHQARLMALRLPLESIADAVADAIAGPSFSPHPSASD